MIFMRPLRRWRDILSREKTYVVEELTKVQGLMPLLMKPRNGQRWTKQEKQELVAHLKRLSRASPYVAVVVLPGGFLLLPLLAWWLDSREERRHTPPRS